jgi:hypothetical protein
MRKGVKWEIQIQLKKNVLMLHNKALELYKQRLKNYDYAFHGNYTTYLHNIQAQFQLDCLPDYLKYGNNYSQNSDIDY